jgi:drug/metabolite transporter (DMT)-like permease
MAADGRAEVGSPDRLTLTAFAALVFIGGSNVVAVSLSNDDLPPFFGAGLRFAVAGSILLAVVAVRRIPLPRGRALFGTVVYGLLGFAVFYALAYWALVHLSAGVAAVMLASVPLLTFFFAWAHGLEPFRWRALVGSMIVIVGIAVLIGGELSLTVPLGPMLAVLGAAAAAAESGVVIKQFPPSSPMATNGLAMAMGALVLLGISALSGERWALPDRAFSWGVFLYLVLLGSVALFGLFLFVLGRWTASAASYFVVLMPIVSAVLAAWVLDEPITWALALGGAVILVGVYVGALSRGKVPLTVAAAIPEATMAETLPDR